MEKQTIVVAGALLGMGKSIARLFLKNGDNVVLNSVNMDQITEVFQELGGGENLAIVRGKVSDRVTGIKLLATAVAKFGSVDVLVNNASVFETKPFFHVDESYLDRFLDTNLKGTFMISQEIIPQMLKQGYGTVINIGMPFITPARGSAPKAGALAPESSVHALTLQLAAEFGKYNISFNTIMQGINSSSTHAATEKSIAEMNLSSGVGELQDIAQMVYTIAKRNL